MISNFTQNRSQDPLTPEQVDILNKHVVCVLERANDPVNSPKGYEVTRALGALRRIVEQAKSAVPELLELAHAYEQWEANLVRDTSAWQTEDGLPHLTQELYDELVELQAKRNAAIARVESRA